MAAVFPYGKKALRLAMLGMVDGNGHPYSWSAIINATANAPCSAAWPAPMTSRAP